MPYTSWDSSSAKFQLVVLLLLSVTVWFIYLPGTSGPWLLDDQPNIVLNDAIQSPKTDWQAISNAMTSVPMESPLGFNRPLSFLSLYLDNLISRNRSSTQDAPTQLETLKTQIKTTNILLHILSGLLLFILTKHILPWFGDLEKNKLANWIPLCATTLWLLHPLHVSTVLYAVQRMTLLAGLFTLAGLNIFVYYRSKLLKDGKGFWQGLVGVMVFTGFATYSKENGALLPLLCLLIELTFFRFCFLSSTPKLIRRIYPAALFFPTMFVAFYLVNTWLNLNVDKIFELRGFTPNQRLLTEIDILLKYIGWFIYPKLSYLTFYHDTQPVREWGSLFVQLITFGFVALLIAAGYCLYRRIFLIPAFGFLFFSAGHLLESTIIPLELVFEHRNYIPYIGLSFSWVWLLIQFINLLRRKRIVIGALLSLCLLTPSLQTIFRVQYWQSEEQLLAHWQKVNPSAPRVWSQTAEYLYRQKKEVSLAQVALAKAFELAPWEGGFGLAQLSLYCVHAPNVFNKPFEYNDDISDINELQSRIIQAFQMPPNTVYVVNQLAGMLLSCPTPAQQKILQPVISAAERFGLTARIKRPKPTKK